MIFHLTHNYLALYVALLYLGSEETCKAGKKLHKIVGTEADSLLTVEKNYPSFLIIKRDFMSGFLE